jgi:hypothetical protein
VRKWEEVGFIKLGSSDDFEIEGTADLNNFCGHAAAIGASLVVFPASPAPPSAVYLAPMSLSARQLAGSSPSYGSMPVEIRNDPPVAAAHLGPLTYKAARVKFGLTNELHGTVNRWKENGFVKLGSSEVVDRNNMTGFSNRLCNAAVAVGASLVVCQITPAKPRAVRRDADGRIDMDALRAKPPPRIYPGGYSVTQAIYLAPSSPQARDLLESAPEFGGMDVWIEQEDG